MDLLKIERTCDAGPSQWEGITSDDRPIYVRYRWGYLSVRLGPKGGDIWDAISGEEIYGEQLGGGLDGFIAWEEVASKADLKLQANGKDDDRA